MKSKTAVPDVLTRGLHFLSTAEVREALGCTTHEVRRLEAVGLLVPRRRERGARRFAASDVLRAFYSRQQFSDGSAALFEARVLELLKDGKSDTDIVSELKVPLALVERMRASKEGRPSQSMQVAAIAPAGAQAPQRPSLVKAASTFLDAGERRLERQRDQRMKEIRKRRAAS